MPSCPHHNLLLLTDTTTDKLRCRRCHLTISRDELGRGSCPECLEVRGERHSDFETVPVDTSGPVRYRCEDCGALVES